MNALLEKFSAVEVKADKRISPEDRAFCEKNQAAYEAALSSFQELGYFWEDMVRTQKEILGDGENGSYHNYLYSRSVHISSSDISERIQSLHGEFIETVVKHFTGTYKVSVSSYDIKEALLPEKPDKHYEEKLWEAYEERMKSIIIRYEDVVDQIILRLDGRSFTEQAFHELTESCHSAAWDQSRMKANFEQKKDTLRFTGYFCSYSDWSNKWELTDGMKKIMRGVLHYETGSYDVVPSELEGLMGYSGTYADLVELPSCKKLTQIKMFKKGRVDLKFSSSEYAEEFIDR